MNKYLDIIQNSFRDYANYLYHEVFNLSWHNYLYWLIALSIVVWIIELLFPWRKEQAAFRKDFWLDTFYMFFNFFLFSLIGFNALSNVGVQLFNDFLSLFGVNNLVAFHIEHWPHWAKFVIIFIVADFIQWNIHRMLHRFPFLWRFHKVHHSVEEMGFAAHLRFHWMESVIYKSIQYIPLAMIGFGLEDFFIVHIFALALGHLNHANIKLTYGPLKYVFNNPVMHLWHHAYEMPSGRENGVNFGLSLSIWDYLFGTAYIPNKDGNTRLGFQNVEQFPYNFLQQSTYPFKRK